MKTAQTMKIAVGATLLALAGMAQAEATYCSDLGGNTDGLSVTDVTYSPNGPVSGPFQNASDCYGFVGGNDNVDDVNALLLNWGSNWLDGVKVNTTATSGSGAPVSLFGGSWTFSLSGTGFDPAGTSGTWTLTATDNNGTGTPPDFPIALDFMVSLKGGPGFGLYFFDDAVFDGSGGGDWEITFTNPQSETIPDLSHMQIFVREGSSSNGSSQTEIPEPGTSALALLGVSLLLGGLAQRRRSRKA